MSCATRRSTSASWRLLVQHTLLSVAHCAGGRCRDEARVLGPLLVARSLRAAFHPCRCS